MTDAIDLEALRDGIRDVLAVEASHERVAAIADGDAAASTALRTRASELGWFALSAPEASGGLDLGPAELAILYHELGRTIALLPVLGSMLLIDGLREHGDDVQREAWIAPLATGEIIGAVSAIAPDNATPNLEITRDAEGALLLSGEANHVLNGADADLWLLHAREGDTDRWLLVDRLTDRFEVQRHVTVDRTRHVATARFDRITLPASRLLNADALAVKRTLLAHAALALAADSIGGADAILAQTLDYLRVREQFGKPIGSFQALKHRCADHKIALVAAGALVDEAAARSAARTPDAYRLVLAAKAMACATYGRIAEDAVQLHGGIGYTWEHPCHLYLKRAKLNEQLFGGESQWLDAAAHELLVAA